MKRVIKILSIVIASIIITGCASSEAYEEPMYDNGSYGMATNSMMAESVDYYEEDTKVYNEQEVSSEQDVNAHGTKLIYTYYISTETTEYETFVSDVKSFVSSIGGYIEGSNYNKSDYDNMRSLSLNIRVPDDQKNTIISMIDESSNVTSMNESTEDVTITYIDLEARKNSYEREIEQLELLAEQTYDVDSLLQIHNSIADLRGEIDSYQTRMNSIDNKVLYATINLDINETNIYTSEETGFFAVVGNGLSESFIEIKDTVANYIIAFPVVLINIILFSIPATIIIFIFMFVKSKIKKFINREKKVKVKEDNKKLKGE